MTKYNGPIKEVEVVEKVKLTKEQESEFKSYKEVVLRHEVNPVDAFSRAKHQIGRLDKHFPNLNNLSVDDFSKAVYIGYEIEPEEPKFENGDKVINVKTGKLSTLGGFRHYIEPGIEVWDCAGPVNELRHATPEEIYWLEELGREKVGDFRIGDIFIQYDGQCFDIDTSGLLDCAYCMYAAGDFRGLHPADSFRPFKKEPSNGNH